jgi:Fic family protein
MSMPDNFDFLNSEIWIKYTQERYVPLEDIKHRLEKLGHDRSDWDMLKKRIQSFRKLGAIPIFINSLNKKFWYFPADCLQQKISRIERKGNHIFEKIENQNGLKEHFLQDSAIEEAITSAIYEGANSTRAKAKEFIETGKAPKNKDEWMLLNNYLAMKWIKDNSASPVTNELILDVHNIVTNNTLEGDDVNFQGKFRNDKVFVGNHQGIDYNKIDEALNEAITVATKNKRYQHGLTKGILLHYFTAYIHPFFDGNGRTARTLFYFKCMKNHLKFVELLSISAHLKRGKGNAYERSFDLVVENDFDVTYFIDYCLDSLEVAIEKVEKKVEYLLNFGLLKKHYDLTTNQVMLLQRLALNKFVGVTAQQHSLAISRSREIARKELKDLHDKKFLKETEKGNQLVYFVDSVYLKEIVGKLALA